MDRALTLISVIVYLLLTVVMIWGWVRWLGNKNLRGTLSSLSRIGFIFATGSWLLAIATILPLHIFHYREAALLRIYSLGGVFSLAAIICSVIGLRRKSVLRWHAPLLSLGVLLFWGGVIAASAGLGIRLS